MISGVLLLFHSLLLSLLLLRWFFSLWFCLLRTWLLLAYSCIPFGILILVCAPHWLLEVIVINWKLALLQHTVLVSLWVCPL
jgi:hypothetical protein